MGIRTFLHHISKLHFESEDTYIAVEYWIKSSFKAWTKISIVSAMPSQCARTDLNKRFLPKPMTTKG